MKFYCNSEEFANAIGVVSKALDSKKGIPILEGIRIVANGTTITLYATDLELFVEKKINAEILIEGEIVVPGKLFAEFIKKLTKFERIEIEKVSDNLLTVKYGESINEIKCLEDEFPEVTSVKNNNVIEIAQKDLKQMIEKTIFCVGVDNARPIIKGGLIEVKDQEIYAVALDGYRLAKVTKKLEKPTINMKMVVPGKNLSEVGRILEDSDDIVRIYRGEKSTTFDLDHTKITSQLLEGEFMDYNRIIPEKYETTVNVSIEDFLSSLDRILIIARNSQKNQARFLITDNKINIFAQSDMSTGKEIVPAKTVGKEIEIAFNCRYITDALSKITSDYVEMGFNNSNTPVKISEIGSNETIYIVLPVRLI